MGSGGQRSSLLDSPLPISHSRSSSEESKNLRAPLEEINRRIAAACERAGRQASEITLVAVSKTVPAARIREAIEAGVRTLGESRIQEADRKSTRLNSSHLGISYAVFCLKKKKKKTKKYKSRKNK